MIDIHSHLLPGVDDGSRSMEQSVAVLSEFAADGVRRLVCTPHLAASGVADAPYEAHVELLERMRAVAPAGVQVDLGWEIMLDIPGADLTAPHLALAGSNAVLVEFQRLAVPRQAADELHRIRCSGVVPVLAHPERYLGCTVEQVREWKRVGAVIQLDTAGLIGRGRVSDLSQELLEAGLVDCFSSDNHGDKRSLARARDWLLEVATPEHAELLTSTNAGRVLSGQPPYQVPPVPPAVRGGLLSRLRGMLGGA